MKLFLFIPLTVLTTKINAETLVFGFYTDDTCEVPRGFDGQNPWTIYSPLFSSTAFNPTCVVGNVI